MYQILAYAPSFLLGEAFLSQPTIDYCYMLLFSLLSKCSPKAISSTPMASITTFVLTILKTKSPVQMIIPEHLLNVLETLQIQQVQMQTPVPFLALVFLPHTSQANLFLLPNFPPSWRDPTRSPCSSRHHPHQVLETLPFYVPPMSLILLLLPKVRPHHFLPEILEISEFGSTSSIHANTSMTSLCTRSHVLTNWNKHHYTIIYWVLLFSINCLQSS